MPQGDKDAYTDKQKRKAAHIEDGYEKRGVSHSEAESRPSGFDPKQTIAERGDRAVEKGRKTLSYALFV